MPTTDGLAAGGVHVAIPPSLRGIGMCYALLDLDRGFYSWFPLARYARVELAPRRV